MVATDDGNNHAEMPQVSVLPMDHVQARYGMNSRASRAAINHHSRPLQHMEELSNAPEVITADPMTMTIEHKTEPHYS